MTVFLFLAALLGGALNSVAGGGSFIVLPALLYAGVSPVSASATTTFVLWPASASSALTYRREIVAFRALPVLLGAVSVAGGLFGGFLLVRTSDVSFMRLLPWLMLLAAATVRFGAASRTAPSTRSGFPAWVLLLQLVIAIYGGYLGGGIGIMMFATMPIAGMTNITPDERP